MRVRRNEDAGETELERANTEQPPAGAGEQPPSSASASSEAPVNASSASAAAAPKKTPGAWAQALGYIVKANPLLPQQQEHAKWEHAAADKLFGWSEHAYHFQDPEQAFELTEETYRAALKCAGDFPACELVQDAIPQSQLERFKDFKRRLTTEEADEAAKKAKAEAKAKAAAEKENG